MIPSAIDYKTCPKCNVPTQADERFCHGCGADIEAERYAKLVEPKMKSARNWILAVGIIYLASAGLLVASGMFPREATTQILVVNGALCAIHIGLYLWAKSAPFPAAVVALVLFVTVQVVNAVLDPRSIVSGILVKIGMLLALSAAVRAGLDVNRLRNRQS
jgi:hypothetical protein